jgi:hypothetical protein
MSSIFTIRGDQLRSPGLPRIRGRRAAIRSRPSKEAAPMVTGQGPVTITDVGGERNIGNSGSAQQQNAAWEWIKGAGAVGDDARDVAVSSALTQAQSTTSSIPQVKGS